VLGCNREDPLLSPRTLVGLSATGHQPAVRHRLVTSFLQEEKAPWRARGYLCGAV
jgi:hypothetical protein